MTANGPRFLGHFACKSVWSCDHCARSRVAQTRSWLRAALMPAMEEQGLNGALLTFTLAHSYQSDWSDVVAKLFDAYTLFDRRMAKHYKAIGSLGKVKTLEAPVGANGLHPHLHVLLTYANEADITGLEKVMRAAWAKAVSEVGGKVNAHGFDFKANCVNDYVAKMEAAHEMASHGTKAARQGGLLLGQLLDRAAKGDTKSGAEWKRAMLALGGRMRFHAGTLPKRLGIENPSDWEDPEREPVEPICQDSESDIPRPLVISYPQSKHLAATSNRSSRSGLALILRAAARGGSAAVHSMVDALANEVAREDVKAGRVVRFQFWPEDYFQKLMLEAAQRPLADEVEVEAYLHAKSIGLCGANVQAATAAAQDSWPEATAGGRDISPLRVADIRQKPGGPPRHQDHDLALALTRSDVQNLTAKPGP